jgi:hypothetical protein
LVIYGGINSTEKNIFWVNDGTQSTASEILFKVLLIKNQNTTSILNSQSINKLQLQIYPNPTKGTMHLIFNLEKKQDVLVEVYDVNGNLICDRIISDGDIGENRYRIEDKNIESKGVYFVYVTVGTQKALHKIVVD